MVISTVALYFYVKQLMQREVEEELYSTRARVESSLRINKPPYSLPPVFEVEQVAQLGIEKVKDTIIYDPSQDEMEEFRELISYKSINGNYYRITVRNLIVESEDILIAIILSYMFIILLVFLIQFYFNRAKNKKLWDPFFRNLEAMKTFSLSSDTPIPLEKSGILEFNELNKEVTILTDKVRTDYKNLKQFTEDVSHELQTPLAIIQAKIENFINGDTLTEIQFDQLTSIQKDIQRLTQMNKRLTLLTKIENKQFVNLNQVNITGLIEETVQNFHEISSAEIEFSHRDKIRVKMDVHLAEVLCNNLISNAIKYSPQEGKIKVSAKGNSLTVSNNGAKALEHPELLYSRFYRESEAAKSTGLGLAIVKRICDYYGFKIGYHFEEGNHIFSITFK
tara:strand:- start:208 stop:1389 length:1182 start_codon:yes stop_codon:yes gene_type:complete